MSPVAGTLLATVVVALSGVAGTIGAAWISRRANDRAEAARAQDAAAKNAIESRKVDQADFDSITRELRQSLRDLRADFDREHDARLKSDQRAADAERRADSAERRADRAERRIAQLERVMVDAKLNVPPPLT